jgi:hypothetical protein
MQLVEQLTHDLEFVGLNTAIAGTGIKLKKEKIKFLVLVIGTSAVGRTIDS